MDKNGYISEAHNEIFNWILQQILWPCVPEYHFGIA